MPPAPLSRSLADRTIPWVILVGALIAYAPSLGGTFLWDDAGHVTGPHLRTFDGLLRIWFEPGATQQYYPLLHSAFWVEYQLWGDSAVAYRLVNVLLHVAAACLFGCLLQRLTLPGAWLAAALFAFHPLCTESVAWISEQKNTLSLVFALTTALAWLRFDSERTPARYALATAWFVAALLTKTVTATLPGALLVLAWWQRGKIEPRRDVVPLLPWFALGLAAGLVTAWFERTQIGAQGESFALSLADRALLAGRIPWFYLGQLVWPASLSFVYPRWDVSAATAAQWLFPLATIALLGCLVCARRSRPGMFAGILIFGGILVPALGFVNVYPFVFSYVADHFAYHASLALFALAGTALASLPTPVARVASVALPVALACLTWSHAAHFRSDLTLFRATLAVNPQAWLAHHNLATALVGSGQVSEAIPHLEATLRLRPDYAEAHNNLGDALRQLGQLDLARTHLERALLLRPNFAAAHNNLGAVLMAQNRSAEALDHFAAAIRIQPRYAEAELNWALALAFAQRLDEAIPHFTRALQLRPVYPQAELMYGRVLALHGRYSEAASHLERAVRQDPASAEAHHQFALVLEKLGRIGLAEQHLAEARRLSAPR